MEITKKPILFSKEDVTNFMKWTGLNDRSITWKGQRSKDFYIFWEVIFLEKASFSDLCLRIDRLLEIVSNGPFFSWLEWLKDQLIVYFFVEKEVPLDAFLMTQKVVPEKKVIITLCNYFVAKFPKKSAFFNNFFQINNVFLPKYEDINFEKIKKELNLTKSVSGVLDDDFMVDLEVTLFPEWDKVFSKITNELNLNRPDYWKTRKLDFLKSLSLFIRDIAVVFTVSVIFLKTTYWFLTHYENQLLNQIELFTPDIFKKEMTLTFRKSGPTTKREVEEFDEVKKIAEKDSSEENFFYDRQDPESDVFVTSIESMPQDFTYSEYEKSNYEELLNVGLRDDVHGQRKVYRILLTTQDAHNAKNKIDELIQNYKGKPVNTVRPGTFVAGGIYYNLFLPLKEVKPFIMDVNHFNSEMRLYVARTQRPLPPDQARVFVWVKII